MYKVLENFGPKEYNDLALDLMTSDSFSWFYHDYVAEVGDKTADEFYFTHTFFSDKTNEINSNFFEEIISPVLFLLDIKDNLIRAKANMFTQRDKVMKYGFHTDYAFEKHTTFLYSVNNNNGYTEFEDGTKIPSKEKQLLIFDGNMKHRSVGQTDTRTRINLNINVKVDPRLFIDE